MFLRSISAPCWCGIQSIVHILPTTCRVTRCRRWSLNQLPLIHRIVPSKGSGSISSNVGKVPTCGPPGRGAVELGELDAVGIFMVVAPTPRHVLGGCCERCCRIQKLPRVCWYTHPLSLEISGGYPKTFLEIISVPPPSFSFGRLSISATFQIAKMTERTCELFLLSTKTLRSCTFQNEQRQKSFG